MFLKVRFWIPPEKFISLYLPGGQNADDMITRKTGEKCRTNCDTESYYIFFSAGLVYNTKDLREQCQGAQGNFC